MQQRPVFDGKQTSFSMENAMFVDDLLNDDIDDIFPWQTAELSECRVT